MPKNNVLVCKYLNKMCIYEENNKCSDNGILYNNDCSSFHKIKNTPSEFENIQPKRLIFQIDVFLFL